MAGLPPGWEWDYDGRRWFYKYKPNGHIQYHFPSEGDEFPHFITDGAPVLDLAPEELLESQQQLRRQTSTGGSAVVDRNGGKKKKTGMSATAGPVSSLWEDTGDDVQDEGVFQPENFMFLGPGTYTDVSPLADEEEEAARRAVAGGKGKGKGVSPLNSQRTTPQTLNSELAPAPNRQSAPTILEEEQQPEVHMLDSKEMPHELPVEAPWIQFNPIGIMAEMATEHTAPARIETHPDPVEMAGNAVLAPIETAVPEGIAELPETSSPAGKIEKKEVVKSPDASREMEVRALKIEKKAVPDGETMAENFQAYTPGKAMAELARSSTPPRNGGRDARTALQREASLLMGPRPKSPPKVDRPANVSPPKAPLKNIHDGTELQGVDFTSPGIVIAPGVMVQVPNLEGKSARSSIQKPSPPVDSPSSDLLYQETAKQNQQELGINKFPSVLKPARGRAPLQPGSRVSMQQPQQSRQTGEYAYPLEGIHPHSMTPAPGQTGLRPGIQRVSTVPEQLPPHAQNTSSEPHQPYRSTDLAGQGAPSTQKGTRPASAMPAFNYGQHQSDRPSRPEQHSQERPGEGLPWQGMNLPYQGRVQGTSLTAFPPSGQTEPPRAPTSTSTSPSQHVSPSTDSPSVQSPQPPLHAQNGRRHSSFVADEVSPMTSRPGSISLGYPAETPSPIEYRRSTSISTNQGVSYTPSPVSLSSQTPRLSPTPPSATSGSRHGSMSQGPPLPGKVPISEGSSYFTAHVAETQGHTVTMPSQLGRTSIGQSQDVSQGHSLRGDQQSSAGQTYQPSQPLSRPTQGPSHNKSPQLGNVPTTSPLLGRIEERLEEFHSPATHIPVSSQNSVVSATQSSHAHPPVPDKVPISRVSTRKFPTQDQPHLEQKPPLESMTQQAQMPMPPQGQGLPQKQPMAKLPAQGLSIPLTQLTQTYMSSQGSPSWGQIPPGPKPLGHMGQGVLQAIPQAHVSPQGQPLHGQAQPGQSQWQPNMPASLTHGSRPSSVPPQGMVGPGHYQRENKWLKWLKGGSKSISYNPQPLVTPSADVFPQSPNQPRPTWGGSEFSQPAVWQPGQPISNQPQSVQTSPDPVSTSSAPVPRTLGPDPTATLMVPAAPESELTQHSDGLSDTASISTTVEVAEATSQPVLKPQVIQVQGRSKDVERVPLQHSLPNITRSDAASGHLSGLDSSDGHARTSSTATIIPHHEGPRLETKVDQTLASIPLLPGSDSHAASQGSRQSQLGGKVSREHASQTLTANKWTNKPAADYSGGDWGDEDDWY